MARTAQGRKKFIIDDGYISGHTCRYMRHRRNPRGGSARNPGPALSYFGMLCAYWTDSTAITGRMLIIWAVITILVTLLDYVLPGYFSKVFGGTRAGITGATVGVFVGLFFGPVGIILGPFFGAVIGELLHERQELGKALKVGIGSLISFIVGSGIKIIASGFMLFYIWRDVWAMIS